MLSYGVTSIAARTGRDAAIIDATPEPRLLPMTTMCSAGTARVDRVVVEGEAARRIAPAAGFAELPPYLRKLATTTARALMFDASLAV
jgi:hypothetical protein